MKEDISVVIPTLTTRTHFLQEAIYSVMSQTYAPDSLIIEIDHKRAGAWETRNRAMLKASTKWTAFLDDDDKFLPHHLEFLLKKAVTEDLDLCWGWFEVEGGTDPFPNHRGRQFSLSTPHIFPIPVLIKTEFLHKAYYEMGGFQKDKLEQGSWQTQDLPVWKHVIGVQGAKHKAYDEITWQWRHHATNTSGLVSKGS
jgi:glycosyltransferase involved in cell wall biosynthesis